MRTVAPDKLGPTTGRVPPSGREETGGSSRALTMSEISSWLVSLLVAGIYLWALFCWPLVRLRRKALAELRSLPTEELEKRTFHYPSEYFEYIGKSHPSVVRFREIVEARDLDALSREWKRLERDFRMLEHQAGHSGRPLRKEATLRSRGATFPAGWQASPFRRERLPSWRGASPFRWEPPPS